MDLKLLFSVGYGRAEAEVLVQRDPEAFLRRLRCLQP